MYDPERLDVASASTSHRRRRCVGSEQLIGELRGRGLLKESLPSPDATYGTTMHAAWAGEQIELSADQARTLEELKRIETMIVADWSGGKECYCLGREERIWVRHGITPLWSGKFDVAYAVGQMERVLILDAKTLYGEIEPAEYNDQLRELVGGFRFNFPSIQQTRVAIISPKLSTRCSIADYDALEAELALRLLRLTLLDSQDPEAPRTPGSYCHRCLAVLHCEEARQLVRATYSLAKRIETGEFALPLGEKGARILDNIKAAEPVLLALKERYKRELAADPDCLPGWRLKPGKRIHEIQNSEAALEKWMENKLLMSDFLSATQVVITKLEATFRAKNNLTGNRLSDRFNELFGALITIKEYAPELKRIKTPRALKDQSHG